MKIKLHDKTEQPTFSEPLPPPTIHIQGPVHDMQPSQETRDKAHGQTTPDLTEGTTLPSNTKKRKRIELESGSSSGYDSNGSLSSINH